MLTPPLPYRFLFLSLPLHLPHSLLLPPRLSFFPSWASSPPPPPSPNLSLLCCFEDRVVSQDLAELVEAMLHLGDTRQLGLQPLFLLGEGEAGRRVQLFEAPASLPVELQQVGVVLPAGGEE